MDIILGADGFLGRNLCEYFREHGWDFVGIGKNVDLRDAAQTDAAFAKAGKAERIFHCVTFQRTGNAQYAMQGELLMNNTRIHSNVLESWKNHQPQAKLISMGSSCTYPESPKPLVEAQFGTGDVHESVRGYSFAKKLLALGSALYAQQYNLQYLHCVLATLYGPHDHKEENRSHFIGGMLHRAAAQKKAGEKSMKLWGTPDVTRETLYVRDQIEAILAADKHFANQILNCAANQPVTIDQTAQAIKQAIGWDVPTEYIPGSFKGTDYKTLDSSQFLKQTGWKPTISLTAGLQKLYRLEYA